MSGTIIRVESLAKRYRLGLKEKKSETFAGSVARVLKSPISNFKQLTGLTSFNGDDESTYWALRDISFEVQEGEVLGIIGRNGAGKSTLLKILSRITEPTSGMAVIKGRVSSLLEVGTGFHPELTGRDNIYMNGTILGMTKREIDRKLDEIIDFSGIEKFVDTPVKFYSSGMKVRLGFSVAAHLEPEVLIIDEVLAVGDFDFQNKCLGRMNNIAEGGRTVLFVSHNMAAVNSLCGRSLVLDSGSCRFEGKTEDAISYYLTQNDGMSSHAKFANSKFFRSVTLRDSRKNTSDTFRMGEGFSIEIVVGGVSFGTGVHVGLFITDLFGAKVGAVSTAMKRPLGSYDNGDTYRVTFALDNPPFVENKYKIDLTLSYKSGGRLEFIENAIQFNVIPEDVYGFGSRLDSHFGMIYFDFESHVESI